MRQSTIERLDEVRCRIELMEGSLPARADAAISPHSKLPFKALWYREALIWRMAELSRGALEQYEQNRLASAILLTRAAVETVAALWFLCRILDFAISTGDLAETDGGLMRLLLGSRDDPNLPQAINVLTFVDYVDKQVNGFRHQYNILSEYSHPNWAGVSGLYASPDRANLWTDFGQNIRGYERAVEIWSINLNVALMLFERNYNHIADIMPEFIELCKDGADGCA